MIFYPRTIKLYLNQVSQVTNNESDLCDENREKLKRDRESENGGTSCNEIELSIAKHKIIIKIKSEPVIPLGFMKFSR